jgi:hypothetical protein
LIEVSATVFQPLILDSTGDRGLMTLSELLGLDDRLPIHPTYALGSVLRIARAPRQELPLRRYVSRKKHDEAVEVIGFSSTCEFSDAQIRDWAPEVYARNPDTVYRFAEEFLIRALHFRIGDLAIATNIARPGSVLFEEAISQRATNLSQDGQAFSWAFREIVEYIHSRGWPPLGEIELPTVVNWLENLPGYSMGKAKGRVSRAVGALSYLIEGRPSDHGQVDLVWALLGLEALYGFGNQGLRAQLTDKTEVLLGPRVSDKKHFGAIYDYRSRFIHGDIDFPPCYRLFEDPESDDDFASQTYECWTIASAVLLSSLQELVRRNASNLEFRYTVSTSEASPKLDKSTDSLTLQSP